MTSEVPAENMDRMSGADEHLFAVNLDAFTDNKEGTKSEKKEN